MKYNPTIRKILSILEPDEFTIAGSGPLWAAKLINEMSDFDIIVSRGGWKKVQNLGEEQVPPSGIGKMIEYEGLQFFTKLNGGYNTRGLIKNSQIIDGVRFVPLHITLQWKRMMNRDKDQPHIKILEDFFRIHK